MLGNLFWTLRPTGSVSQTDAVALSRKINSTFCVLIDFREPNLFVRVASRERGRNKRRLLVLIR
jgi:hypothetical protein